MPWKYLRMTRRRTRDRLSLLKNDESSPEGLLCSFIQESQGVADQGHTQGRSVQESQGADNGCRDI